jgi:flavorubredoxin
MFWEEESNMNPDAKPVRKAVVIFDTRYGNTRKVAQALAKGIHKNPIEVATFNIHDAKIGTLSGYDFIAIGGPTHYATASKPMKDFLKELEQTNLRGKYGFAFDTRVDSFWAGSAAKVIERKLKASGLQIVRPHSSAIVSRSEEGEKSKEAETVGTREEKRARRAREKEERRAKVTLEQGMEQLFEKIGAEMGEILVKS